MGVAKPNSSDRFGGYSRVSIILHWFTAGAVLFLFLFHDESVVSVHIGFGFVLAPVLLGRIFWRLRHGFPRVADQHPLLNALSRLTKFGLLACVLVLVVTGFLMVPFGDEPIRMFFLPEMQLPSPPWLRVAQFSATLHAVAAYALVVLLAIHIAQALKHLLIDESSIVRRMLTPIEKGF